MSLGSCGCLYLRYAIWPIPSASVIISIIVVVCICASSGFSAITFSSSVGYIDAYARQWGLLLVSRLLWRWGYDDDGAHCYPFRVCWPRKMSSYAYINAVAVVKARRQLLPRRWCPYSQTYMTTTMSSAISIRLAAWW